MLDDKTKCHSGYMAMVIYDMLICVSAFLVLGTVTVLLQEDAYVQEPPPSKMEILYSH